MLITNELDFEKLDGGLLPAIIVDHRTNQVLMLGFMNHEALKVTLKTTKVTFYSRTKERLWTKGETSGNYLKLVSIKSDCDNDTLLISAEPIGPTCHTGEYSCFGEAQNQNISWLLSLFNLIKERKSSLPEGSYTTKLFTSGENRIIQKVGEEAIETVIAAKNNDKNEIVNEVSDLLYHLFVMLAEKGIELTEIANNLKERHSR